MATLEFPFWIVLDAVTPQSHGLGVSSQAALLFTTVDKLVEHLASMLGTHPQVMFVEGRENLLMAVADLHLAKIEDLDIDPTSPDKPQSSVSVREMLQKCHEG